MDYRAIVNSVRADVIGWTVAVSVVFTIVFRASDARAAVYSESFNGATVPSNWAAQNGTAGTATLSIADDTGGINTGNALSISSATRQGVIGTFPETMFANVGDTIELRFDTRLTSFPNNSGGFRFGLYHDNSGASSSSGYRALVGTGNNSPRTDVQADGGDTDIGFGTNRENPPDFMSNTFGFNDSQSHSMAMILTRTATGVAINVQQDGVAAFSTAVEHITGTGAGTPIPLQTKFNQIMFTTNGGYTGLIDNLSVSYFVPGDVTGDGLVNNDDFNIILGAMFTNVSSRLQGDLTGDGFVDFRDYRIWKDAPKSGSGSASAEMPIPEPATLGLMSGIVTGLIMCTGRRKRSRMNS